MPSRIETSDLDALDHAVLRALMVDARASYKDLGAAVGLSAPAVRERMRRMEAAGVITGYAAEVNPRALGYTLEALVRFEPIPGAFHVVRREIEETDQIDECVKVTGDDCFVARLLLRSIDELTPILERFGDRARTNTSIINATPVKRRPPAFD